MKMSSLSKALKLLLLLTSLCHHYSGLVTGADPAKDICTSIAANKPVNFFLIGHNSKDCRLLITAKPDYLVYELPADSVHDDWVSLYNVKPVQLKEYYPVLFKNKYLVKLLHLHPSSDVHVFTVENYEDDGGTISTKYLKIIFLRKELLFSYNMNTSTLEMVTNFTSTILPTQQFVPVTFTENIKNGSSIYSFFKLSLGDGSRRILYNFTLTEDMQRITFDYTCKGDKPDTMVLRPRERNCDWNPGYYDWDWTDSPRGWAYMANGSNTIRFYLFSDHQQQVYIFDQNDQNITESDVFSVVRTKNYGDFFWCHSGTPSPSTSTQPSTTTEVFTTTVPTTSTQPSTDTTIKVSKQTTTVPNTSSQPVNGTTTTASSPTESSSTLVSILGSSMTTEEDETIGTVTFSSSTKSTMWQLILGMICIGAIIFIVVGIVWCVYEHQKSKAKKIATPNSKQLGVGGTGPVGSKLNANSGTPFKVSIQSSMVAPSKGLEAKVQGLKM